MSDRAPAHPSVWSIPPHRSFADSLVAGILARRRDPLDLARGRILLPTNRAVRTVRDAFVRASGEGLLLPRLIAIGDPELDERLGAALDPIEDDPIPPAIAPEERLFLLAGILARQSGSSVSALREAADLARTLDQLTVEEKQPRDLKALDLPAEELATHWQHLLQRLDVIFDHWPAILESRGLLDAAERRNRVLRRLRDRWRTDPPPGFTIAAGITTTAPAVAELLGTIARLPEGQVVLPALAREREMPAGEWDALKVDPEIETGAAPSILVHPQYHLRLLLDRMKVARGEVRDWHRTGPSNAEAQRSRVIFHAMTGAAHTHKWADLEGPDRRLGTGVAAAEFHHPSAEAMGIAIALRRALETPGRTASLVTPDRGLARRVSAILRRWDIEADDSAGDPLALTAPGALSLLLLEAVEDEFGPVSLMALAKHPLVVGSPGERGDWLRDVRRVDRALRGPRPGPGLHGIAAKLAEEDPYATPKAAAERERRIASFAAIRPRLEQACKTIADADTLAALAAALREALSSLTDDRAWVGAAGRELAALVEQTEHAAGAADLAIAPGERVGAWRSLLAPRSVRPPYGGHPRIQILGLLEARLVQSDLMVLGGLNEGSWPAATGADPWLAPSLRRRLGLPGLDYRVGLAAHDFMSALGAPEVLLTRSVRDERAPTVASRLWLRLEAIGDGIRRDEELVRLAEEIDRPRPGDAAPAARPAPRVPLDHRPRRISVTSVNRLRGDPYAFYAGKILGLSALDILDSRSIAAWQGTRVHDWLEHWVRDDGAAPEALAPQLDAMLARADVHPLLRSLWGARLRETFAFLQLAIAEDRASGRVPKAVEAKAETSIGSVTVHGRADRLDACPDGGIAIVDYKTGGSPTRAALKGRFEMQLGLLGLIAKAGGFPDVGTRPVALEYWKLGKAGKTFGTRFHAPAPKQEMDDYLAEVEAEMERVAAAYLTGDEPFIAKLNPAYAPYGDYDQLMRLEEWYGRD